MEHASHMVQGPLGGKLEVVTGGDLPHSREAEEFLLASVLSDETGKAWGLAINCGIKSKAFWDPSGATLWDLLIELRARGEACTFQVILEELKLRGKLDDVGGVPWLIQVTGRTPMPTFTRYYAELVKLLWDLRHAVSLAAQLREASLAFEGREEFVEKAGKVGQSLIRLGRREASQTLFDIYGSVEAEARARAEGTVDKSVWISSGIPKFDQACKLFNSAREDGLVVIAGGSGHGKSVALRQIGLAALRAGQVVLSYSRETSTAGFIEMLVSSQLGFDLNQIEHQPQDRLEKFYAECQRQAAEWADKKLYCVQNEPATPLTTIEDLTDHVRAFVHMYGKPHVILVDYLQIFEARKKVGGHNREATVAYVSHTLQALQRELDVPIIVAVQLNEGGLNEMRQIRRDENDKVIHRLPKPGDLRESQAIYHDADRVIFLYKPPVDCTDRDQTSPATTRPEVWWFQEKRRRGGIEIVRCWLEKRYTRFVAIGDNEFAHEAQKQVAATGTVPKGVRVGKDRFLGGGA